MKKLMVVAAILVVPTTTTGTFTSVANAAPPCVGIACPPGVSLRPDLTIPRPGLRPGLLPAPGRPAPPAPAPSGPSGSDIGGAIIGGIIGGVIADGITRPRQPRVIYRDAPRRERIRRLRVGDAHIDYCLSKYRSYNPRTNTYRSYSGVNKPCYSPYM